MKLLIAVPCHDQVQAGFAHDLAYLIGSTVASVPDWEIDLAMRQGTLLPTVREGLVEDALTRNVDAIFWLDADMRFPNDALLRLAASGEAVIGANYPSRRAPIMPTAWGDVGPIYTDEYSPDREPVERLGFGVLFTRTEVFRKLPQPWFPVEWDADLKDYRGENKAFCAKARLAGYDIVCDHVLSRQVRHEGVLPYTHGHALMTRARAEVRA